LDSIFTASSGTLRRRRLRNRGFSVGTTALGFEGKQEGPFTAPALHFDAACDEAGEEIPTQTTAIPFRVGRRFDLDPRNTRHRDLRAGRFQRAE
jgi:hypothetical protein